MKIAFGCDHGGFTPPEPLYQPEILKHLEALGHKVDDCGTDGPDSVDYPDFAVKVCEKILAGEAEAGILLCVTGIGMSMTANRFKGIRAALCTSTEMARHTRDHNDSNVLCLGRGILSLQACFDIIDVWLAHDFSGVDRHIRRIEKMG